jgi:hypothetical protein
MPVIPEQNLGGRVFSGGLVAAIVIVGEGDVGLNPI